MSGVLCLSAGIKGKKKKKDKADEPTTYCFVNLCLHEDLGVFVLIAFVQLSHCSKGIYL